MNINFQNSGSKKPAIGFGLNKRGGNVNANPSKKKKKKKSSIFDNSSDDDDEDGPGSANDATTSDSRKRFNQELVAEQQVLRQRAEKAMAAAASSEIYNYDAEYESFSAGAAAEAAKSQRTREQEKQPKERKSRYIAKLLETAKDRKQEHEILHERKVAREQAAEEQNHEYMGKEKFITKSYKRKLEEREQWLKKDSVQRQQEEIDDVRKKTGGSALMGLNWSKMGSTSTNNSTRETTTLQSGGNGSNTDDFLPEDERKLPSSGMSTSRRQEIYRGDSASKNAYQQDDDEIYEDAEEVELDQELMEQAKRAQRLKKILAARERYLQRKENAMKMHVAS